jgi:lipopolysaccharide biosynthesis regulator YciM
VAWLALILIAVAGVSLVWWRRWRRLDRSKAAGEYLKGFRYLLSGDPDEAIALLTKVASDGALDAYFALGSLFRRKGELERAIQLHRNILLIPGLDAATRTQALGELGRDFRQGALYTEAVEALEAACVDAEADDRLRSDLRDCYLSAGMLEDAAAWQGRIYSGPRGQDDLGAHLWSELAETHVAAGEMDEAQEMVTYALEAAPRSLHARFVRAEVLGAKGSRLAARRDVFRLIEESPWVSAIALPWLWTLHERADALEELASDFDSFFRHLPLYPHAVLLHARLLRRQGRVGEAAHELRRLVQTAPGFLEAHHELGQLLLSAGRPVDFPAEYQSLLGAIGTDPALGRCHHCEQPTREVRWRCPSCQAYDWFQDAWVPPTPMQDDAAASHR